jgi:hypothetical protein
MAINPYQLINRFSIFEFKRSFILRRVFVEARARHFPPKTLHTLLLYYQQHYYFRAL